MLITFKSKAAADVIMYQEHAKPILDLWQKDVKRGVLTAAETSAALAKLNAKIAESHSQAASNDEQQGDPADEQSQEAAEVVSFATRVYPLQEMLRAAQRSNADIAWGI